MKKNVFTILLIPCILACIFVVLLILDSQNISFITMKPANMNEGKTSDSIKPTNAAGSSATPAPGTSEPSLPNGEDVEEKTETPEVVPEPTSIVTPSVKPTPKATPTAKPVATPTSAPTPSPTTAPRSDTSEEKPTPSPNPENPTNEQSPENNTPGTYQALYTQEGNGYTLIADKLTKSFLFMNQEKQSIRKTAYTYHPRYEQPTVDLIGPILGYRNNQFVFIANHQLIISDGLTETVLKTFDKITSDNDLHVNLLLLSENRILAGIGGELHVIDCRTSTIENYTEPYSTDFVLFTDEYLCFSSKKRIPDGPYYHYLYTAANGKALLLASIGEIEDYVLDKDTAIIKANGELFQINLKTNTFTSSKSVDRERTLYFPVYGDGIIQGLDNIRFINYNNSMKPLESIQLPASWKAECYYNTYYNLAIFSLYMNGKEELLPNGSAGSFAAIDYTIFPLDKAMFIKGSTVKEKIYSGKTLMGEGEIYLLERTEISKDKVKSFETIYAWIPIQGETRAYQLYLNVPFGEEKEPYVKLIKQFLQIQ